MTFSFIIPHRNTPELLRRCLASIPVRGDLEVIVADDGSDLSVRELEDLVKGHPCARLMAMGEHRGAGHARNAAIDEAKGEWLLFADADDYFTTTLCDVLDERATGTEADVVVLNALTVDEGGTTGETLVSRYVERLSHSKGRRRRLALEVLTFATWTPWSRMIRRKLVEANGIRFEEIPVGNDAMFVLRCSLLARGKTEVESRVCYHYYQPSAGSQTWREYTDETIVARLALRLRINALYREAGFPFLLPVSSKVPWERLVASQREEMRRLLQGHNSMQELRARVSQLAGRLTGVL